MFKGLLSGIACGATAALLLHGLVLAFEFPLERQGIFLRQSIPVFPLEAWVRLDAPMLLDRAAAGATWGAMLGVLIHGGRLPHRMTGLLFGGVVITGIGYSVIIDPYAGGIYHSWKVILASGALGAQVMLNASWGALTGLLILFTDALRMSLRNDLSGPNLRA